MSPWLWDKHPYICAPVWAKKERFGQNHDGVRGWAFAPAQHSGKRPPTSYGSSPQADGNISSRMRTVQRL